MTPDVSRERVPESLSRNLEKNVLAVVVGMGITGALGLVYWGVAARLFTPTEVGRASAIINGTLALAIMSTLSIGAVFERFLYPSGRLGPRLVVMAFGFTAVVGGLVGCGYVYFNRNSPIFDEPWSAPLMPVWIIIIVWYSLIEPVCSALLVARWAALKNSVHSLFKVLLLFPAAAVGSAMAIVLSWMVPAALLFVILAVFAWRKMARSDMLVSEPRLPPLGNIARYAGSALWLTTLGSMAPLLIPLIVVSRIGLEANAFFSVSWALVSAVLVMLGVIGGPLVSEVVSDPHNVNHYIVRFSLLAGGIAVVGGVGLAFVGPELMGFINAEYQAKTTTALRLFGAAIPFMVVNSLFLPLCRVVKQLKVPMICEAITVAIFLGGGWFLLPTHGLEGLAISFLLAHIVNSIMLIGPLVAMVRRIREFGIEQEELV